MTITIQPTAPASSSRIRGLACRECGQLYPAGPAYVCETCFGPLEVAYDYAAVAAAATREAIAAGPPTLWRYRALLPIEDTSAIVDSHAGFTPLLKADNLGRVLGLRNLWVK